MTRIDFHFNVSNRENYICRLLRKVYRAEQRAVFFSPDHVLVKAIDDGLWTLSETDFIPHIHLDKAEGDSDLSEIIEPIVLLNQEQETPHCDILISGSNETPNFFGRFERLIEIVSPEISDREKARERWRWYKDRGYGIQTFDAAKK
jgi:DNA polymerase III subunit chi